jgi:hypothetical protein
MLQRTRKLHLTHRAVVADVLGRRNLGGHRITAQRRTYNSATALPTKIFDR